jgi:general secretion pathway protein B
MSLILEALRKSEAERRRGRAPDLHAELPPAHARSRRMPPPWLWIAATIVLLLVAMLLWMRGRDAPGSVARDEQEPAANTAQEARAPTDEGEPATASSPPPFPRVDRIAAPPAEPAPTPAPAASPAPRIEEQNDNDAVATTAPAREATAAPPPSEPAVTATDAPPSPANTPAPTSAPAPASASPPTRSAIARLSELPPAERKQLPAMKLSMHMWNERPAQRFVIIDGQRYVEGDRIGNAVIDAIDSDGVILDLNGRAVRLPIR